MLRAQPRPSLDVPDLIASSDAVVAGTLAGVADDGDGITIRVDSRFRAQRLRPGTLVRIHIDASLLDPAPSVHRVGPHKINLSLTGIGPGEHRVFFLQYLGGAFYPTSDYYPSVAVSDTLRGPFTDPLQWIAASSIEDQLAWDPYSTPDQQVALLALTDTIPADVSRPLLLQQQQHPGRIDATRLRRAAEQMRRIGEVTWLPLAVAAFTHPAGPRDPEAVAAFLDALGGLKLWDPEPSRRLLLVQCMAPLVADNDPRARAAAFSALGNTPSPAAIPLLRGGLDDPDPRARQLAVRGLAAAQPP